MEWKQGRRSSNVEDRRGSGIPRAAGIGGGGLILLLLVVLLGGDPSKLLSNATLGAGPSSAASAGQARSPEEEELADFVSVVLASTEDVWAQQFRQMGRTYEPPGLVLFSEAVQSACGTQSASVGPFYCPGDRKAYIDLGFYQELRDQLGAPGDFAQAYVLAHEVGHHVQNLLGTSDQVHDAQRGLGQAEANQLSVRLELQADFYAGVWARHAQQVGSVRFDDADLDEAINAASKIGDDYLQRRARGRVSPESFTHGTSEQRVRWFRRGFQTGDPAQGDTFVGRDL